VLIQNLLKEGGLAWQRKGLGRASDLRVGNRLSTAVVCMTDA
jgi:hypothetical protein